MVIILTIYWVNTSRRDCGTYEGDEKCLRNLEGKCEEKRPLGQHRCRGKIMLKRGFKEITLHLCGLVSFEHGNKPLDSIKFREFLD
jgi:hypothetical protein